MTAFEILYTALRPFEHPLHQFVMRTLRALAKRVKDHTPLTLDVGGRRSNYTINVPSEVWITDLPREHAIQHQLDLGATDAIRTKVLSRRSNVTKYLYDDMCSTTLPSSTFDIVVAVEVLEHVEKDEAFVKSVRRVLRHGGTFVMTTPNGDRTPIPYPDHKRHYFRRDLHALLAKHFSEVHIEYRVTAGPLFRAGLRRPSGRSPLLTIVGMLAFAASAFAERVWPRPDDAKGKMHLVAICRTSNEPVLGASDLASESSC